MSSGNIKKDSLCSFRYQLNTFLCKYAFTVQMPYAITNTKIRYFYCATHTYSDKWRTAQRTNNLSTYDKQSLENLSKLINLLTSTVFFYSSHIILLGPLHLLPIPLLISCLEIATVYNCLSFCSFFVDSLPPDLRCSSSHFFTYIILMVTQGSLSLTFKSLKTGQPS